MHEHQTFYRGGFTEGLRRDLQIMTATEEARQRFALVRAFEILLDSEATRDAAVLAFVKAEREWDSEKAS